MRESRPLQRILASLLAVVYATVVMLGTALVKCQETDGTTVTEWRGADCCVAETSSEPGCTDHSVSPPARDDDCGGCQDRPFAETLVATSAARSVDAAVPAPDVTPPPPAAALPPAAAFLSGPEPSARQVRAPHPPPSLAGIRTTVLRC